MSSVDETEVTLFDPAISLPSFLKYLENPKANALEYNSGALFFLTDSGTDALGDKNYPEVNYVVHLLSNTSRFNICAMFTLKNYSPTFEECFLELTGTKEQNEWFIQFLCDTYPRSDGDVMMKEPGCD